MMGHCWLEHLSGIVMGGVTLNLLFRINRSWIVGVPQLNGEERCRVDNGLYVDPQGCVTSTNRFIAFTLGPEKWRTCIALLPHTCNPKISSAYHCSAMNLLLQTVRPPCTSHISHMVGSSKSNIVALRQNKLRVACIPPHLATFG
jgi:hypothetical protein